MERMWQDLEWWVANWPVIAGLFLWLLSLLSSILPLVIVQRRLPNRTLAELKALDAGLVWLRWGYPAAYVVTGSVFLWAMFGLRQPSLRMSDAAGFFLMGAVFCIFPVSAGIMAVKTGFYRGMTGRGFTGDYYRLRDTELSWLPRAQIACGVLTAAVSLAGFFAQR
jgi:hypothetical protein